VPQLGQKVALITGAGGGLGRAQAVRFVEEGARVVITDLAPEATEGPIPCVEGSTLAETEAAVRKAGGVVVACHADVRRLADMEAIAQLATEKFGSIDLVCANAGIWAIGLSWELAVEDWQRVIDVNLTGAWFTARAAVSTMQAQRSGSIVFTSSIAALKGSRHMAPYVASKSGLLGLMRTMANELGAFGIRVNAILPGLIATPMVLNDAYLQHARPDLEHPRRADVEDASKQRNALSQGMLRPEEIAEAALWLGSDASRFVTGVALPVDAGAAIA
jgi:NAD(P)-dependent dehydrogenase (short-subunit alcohol dehydrogenase family)